MANEVFDYEHFNLNEIDPEFHPVEKGLYSLRVSKLAFKTVVPKAGKRVDMETPLVQASFAIINHDQFSGRRVNQTFWMLNPFDQKALKRLQNAVGIPQEQGESFKDYIERLSAVTPAPEFRAYVDTVAKGVDEATGKPQEDNVIKWNNVLPIN